MRISVFAGGNRRLRGKTLLLVATLFLDISVDRGIAQDQVRNFTDPILVLDTGGHHAEVRSLLFIPDSNRLLSAGRDKIIYEWDFDEDSGRPRRTFRPPLFRGVVGSINAIALSASDAEGQRILVVAGNGFVGSGQMMLFRYPGIGQNPTGDLVGFLPGGDRMTKPPIGHLQAVECLAIDPKRGVLASGSSDTRIRIWDLPRRKTIAVLEAADQSSVYGLGFTPDGSKLVSGGEDGMVRVWDVRAETLSANRPIRPIATTTIPPGLSVAQAVITRLAVSPDGKYTVAGRENGYLDRYTIDATNLSASRSSLPVTTDQGAVEALSFARDGRLATSLVRRFRRGEEGTIPEVNCDVEIRSMPDGRVIRKVFSKENQPPNPIGNLVRSLAFSDDGRYLALAGGDQQSVLRLRLDTNDPGEILRERKGTGSTIWGVGFTRDSKSVAFTRSSPFVQVSSYETFDLARRLRSNESVANLVGPLKTFENWSVTPRDPLTLDVRQAGGRGFTIALNRTLDRRWWSYTFVKPDPKHPRPMLAVACELGVAFYRLEDGVRTRFFAGHNGPVLGVAPSPDGKWLATCSSDQTVRLWMLEGCDQIASLGAEFPLQTDGRRIVTSVGERSFAEAMGLKIGDVIIESYFEAKKVLIDEFVKKLPKYPPAISLNLLVERDLEFPFGYLVPKQRFPLLTTRRDSPALNLFPFAEGNEWVMWMPKGYYDTSTDGDAYLVWHLNRSTRSTTRPTDALSARTFEAFLRQKPDDVAAPLNRLIATADVAVALRAAAVEVKDPPTLVEARALPKPQLVRPAASALPPPLAVTGLANRPVAPGEGLPDHVQAALGTKSIDLGLNAEVKAGQLARIDIKNNGTTSKRLDPQDLGRGVATNIAVYPGSNVISVTLSGVDGVSRSAQMRVDVPSPPAEAAAGNGRVIILAVGPTYSSRSIPDFPYGSSDVEKLGKYLADHLISPTGAKGQSKNDILILNKGDATAERLIKALDDLASGPLGPNDRIVLVIESHVIPAGKTKTILSSDIQDPKEIPRGITSDLLGERLGKLAHERCPVLLILDGEDQTTLTMGDRSSAGGSELNEWIRQLRDQQDITVLLASDQGPSRDAGNATRALAAAVLLADQPTGRPRVDPRGAMTLNEFAEAVKLKVPSLTKRTQTAGFYLPETQSGRFPFFLPKPRSR